MDSYVTGITIKMLREKQGLTQTALGNQLNVSSKTVSKQNKRLSHFRVTASYFYLSEFLSLFLRDSQL